MPLSCHLLAESTCLSKGVAHILKDWKTAILLLLVRCSCVEQKVCWRSDLEWLCLGFQRNLLWVLGFCMVAELWEASVTRPLTWWHVWVIFTAGGESFWTPCLIAYWLAKGCNSCLSVWLDKCKHILKDVSEYQRGCIAPAWETASTFACLWELQYIGLIWKSGIFYMQLKRLWEPGFFLVFCTR